MCGTTKICKFRKFGSSQQVISIHRPLPSRKMLSFAIHENHHADIKRFNPAMAIFLRTSASIAEIPTEIPVWDQQNTGNFNSRAEDIITLCQQGRLKDALRILYSTYQTDSTAYAPLLHRCATMKALSEGRRVHVHLIKTGFVPDCYVGNHLVNMYAKCGNLENASQVFDNMPERNVVSWTAMISGYDQYGLGNEALRLFCQMLKAASESMAVCRPNQFTLASVISACGGLGALEQGKQVHVHTVKTGFQSVVIVCNALVTMYAKCGLLKDARQVFDEMPERDQISWNSMIAGYAERVHDEEALKLFEHMHWGGFKPDHFTLSSVLSVCANLAAIGQGRDLHTHVISSGIESDVAVGNALIDMYAKCGSIDDARRVFDIMPKPNIISWNAMIVGYAQHGHGSKALKFFGQMQRAVMKPNKITLLGVLTACNHVGLVDEGWNYFYSMSSDYGISPEPDHYACMVDLLGRAGCLSEAEDLIREMPFEPDAVIWSGLLAACRLHNNAELGQRVAEYLFDMEPQSSAAYIVLSNIYAASGRWDCVAKVRKLMKDRGLKKEPGCSWIEVKNKVHIFIIDDELHLQVREIYATLGRLAR